MLSFALYKTALYVYLSPCHCLPATSTSARSGECVVSMAAEQVLEFSEEAAGLVTIDEHDDAAIESCQIHALISKPVRIARAALRHASLTNLSRIMDRIIALHFPTHLRRVSPKTMLSYRKI